MHGGNTESVESSLTAHPGQLHADDWGGVGCDGVGWFAFLWFVSFARTRCCKSAISWRKVLGEDKTKGWSWDVWKNPGIVDIDVVFVCATGLNKTCTKPGQCVPPLSQEPDTNYVASNFSLHVRSRSTIDRKIPMNSYLHKWHHALDKCTQHPPSGMLLICAPWPTTL